jgi:hypothetical protein
VIAQPGGIGTLLDRFKPEECANYLLDAGYASP